MAGDVIERPRDVLGKIQRLCMLGPEPICDLFFPLRRVNYKTRFHTLASFDDQSRPHTGTGSSL